MQTIPLTDADLLTRYLRAGDEDAFAALLRTHERLVIGTATRQPTSATEEVATLSSLPLAGAGYADTLPARSFTTYLFPVK